MEQLEKVLELNPQDAHELFCESESSASLDSILEEVYERTTQLESPKSFQCTEGLFDWEVGLYESPCLERKKNEFLQEACLIEPPFLKRENQADEGWIENEEIPWTNVY
ncbi:hypothetical protein SUGI_0708790 [Cryptomeria japonica]|nr:hypothetical protein SUGI_0708790 [Cryptomeria japonica]